MLCKDCGHEEAKHILRTEQGRGCMEWNRCGHEHERDMPDCGMTALCMCNEFVAEEEPVCVK